MKRAVVIGDSLSGSVKIGEEGLPFFCGPCVIESRDSALRHAEALKGIFERTRAQLIFKSSFDKANRTSSSSFRGIGRDEGLRILEEVRQNFSLPVVTDIHSPEDIEAASSVVDVLQVPAFLCRQTDLLLAAGKTGKPILVKKGQFVHPQDMQFAVQKIESTGNNQTLLCERGTCFGYRELVVDYRSLAWMREFAPVIFDATHSVQVMGGKGGSSTGFRDFVPGLARAAIAFGCDGIFIEVHENPDSAPSDGPNMLRLSDIESLLVDLVNLHELDLGSRKSH